LRRPTLPAAALVAALAGCSHAEPDAGPLYQANCARCHGPDGRGDSRSVALYPHLDLTASAMVRTAARGPIFQRIADGYGVMPGFANRLETDDIKGLVDYVLRLPRRQGGP
jgi:mono/diheme cytochrome c family protein